MADSDGWDLKNNNLTFQLIFIICYEQEYMETMLSESWFVVVVCFLLPTVS
jgi:hypothetical protein